MNKNITVTVVIPVKDSERTLKFTLDSISSSSIRPKEIIIVDDGSAIPVQAPKLMDTINIVRFETSQGPAAARNSGAQMASGEITLFIDSDVILNTDTIEQMLLPFSLHPEIAAVQGIYSRQTPETNLVSKYQNAYYHYAFRKLKPGETSVCATFCFAIRTEIFLKSGGFDARILKPTVEDEAYGYQLSGNGYTIYLNPKAQVTHLAKYRIISLIKRKIRMSFHQTKNLMRGVNLPLFSEKGRYQNRTHHSGSVLFAILLSAFIPVSLIFGWEIFAILSLLYFLSNFFFWFFLCKTESCIKMPFFIFITWLDQLSILIGIVSGSLHYIMGHRY